MFCEFRDIAGKPRTGFHKTRFLDIAAYDLLGTIVIAIAISYVLKFNFIYTFLSLMCLAIIVHRLFCVNTKVNTMIFGIV
jgi:hypothetical protein